MKKARSRLQSTNRSARLKTSKNKKLASSKLLKKLKILIFNYIKHLPTLILSLAFYLLIWKILHQVYPQDIKNFLIEDAYLPLLLVVFLANFFFFSFLLLSSRRGLLISIYLNILVSLYLQQVIINWQLAALLLFIFVIIDILLISCKKNSKRN